MGPLWATLALSSAEPLGRAGEGQGGAGVQQRLQAHLQGSVPATCSTLRDFRPCPRLRTTLLPHPPPLCPPDPSPCCQQVSSPRSVWSP